jgi:hypothetical protein
MFLLILRPSQRRVPQLGRWRQILNAEKPQWWAFKTNEWLNPENEGKL